MSLHEYSTITPSMLLMVILGTLSAGLLGIRLLFSWLCAQGWNCWVLGYTFSFDSLQQFSKVVGPVHIPPAVHKSFSRPTSGGDISTHFNKHFFLLSPGPILFLLDTLQGLQLSSLFSVAHPAAWGILKILTMFTEESFQNSDHFTLRLGPFQAVAPFALLHRRPCSLGRDGVGVCDTPCFLLGCMLVGGSLEGQEGNTSGSHSLSSYEPDLFQSNLLILTTAL